MNNNDAEIYQPVVRKSRGISPLWLLPVLAFALAGWLLYNAMNSAGEPIKIYFKDAQGLVPGRTVIRYQGLQVGMVRNVTLSPDLNSIYADAEIYPEATKLLAKDTEFWLVKPKATVTGISGLDALVSGNYIAVAPGKSKEQSTVFTAVDEPVNSAAREGGLDVKLFAPDLGSLSVGSQIYYKKIPVGEVFNFRLTPDNKSVEIYANIKPQYKNLVKSDSRFWNVSGVAAQVGFDGINVQFDSLSALIGGAIAFDSPANGSPSVEGGMYTLYSDINSAQRGVRIKIDLPKRHNIRPKGAPIMYQGLEIGRVDNIEVNKQRGTSTALVDIDPSMADLLKSGTKFILEVPEVGLTQFRNISNIVTGNYLTLVPGQGKPSRDFTAISRQQQISEEPGTLHVKLDARDAYGINESTKVIHRGIEVGFIDRIGLADGEVQMTAVIYHQYAHLVRQKSQFFILGGISGNISADGVEFSVPAVAQIASPAVSFTSEGAAGVKAQYNLYTSKFQARSAQENRPGSSTLRLVTDSFPQVSAGSPVLYRRFPVGRVQKFGLSGNRFYVDVDIENQYRHLLTKDTVFWNQSGLDIKANLEGVEISAGPLKSVVNGGIGFGNMPGTSAKSGKYWKLYNSRSEAASYGKEVTLYSPTAEGLKKGSTIRYKGINVGEVRTLKPEIKAGNVQITARLYPEYASTFTQSNTYYWVVKPKISLTEAENLDSLLGTYVAVEPGKGLSQSNFTLHQSRPFDDGLTIVLESETRGSVSVGTPLIYRDFEVGTVTRVELGSLADRVLIYATVGKNYAYLVRRNTVFWNASGVDVSIGLTGASIKTGTVDSLIKGGIAFATPDTQTLERKARNGQHFFLYSKADENWKKWRTAIPAP